MMQELTAFVEDNLQLQEDSLKMKQKILEAKKENLFKSLLLMGIATLESFFRCWRGGVEVIAAERKFEEAAAWAREEQAKTTRSWEEKIAQQQTEWLSQLEEARHQVDEDTQSVLNHEMEKACIEEEKAQVGTDLRQSQGRVLELRRKLER